MLKLEIERLKHDIENCDGFQMQSRLQVIEDGLACALPAALGDQCVIVEKSGRKVPAEVIGFKRGLSQLAPFEFADEIRAHALGVELFDEVPLIEAHKEVSCSM